MPKNLMTLAPNQMRDLSKREPETGMGFQIVKTPSGFAAVLEDRSALLCYRDKEFYDVVDLLGGEPIPETRRGAELNVSAALADRATAFTALQGASISPSFTGNAGAVPLIASYPLRRPTIFYRYLSSAVDLRYVSGRLSAGTYLTTRLDKTYVNSGFATVGRFALPIPLPASHVIQYELPRGVTIKVGTVPPMFGQSGGGVEVQVPSAQVARRVRRFTVPDY